MHAACSSRVRGGLDDRAQRVGDPAAAADHAAEIVLGDLELEHDLALDLLELLDLDRVGLRRPARGRGTRRARARLAARARPGGLDALGAQQVATVGSAGRRARASAGPAPRRSTISEGSVCGLYWPIVSIVRPSRGERWSATTIRQIGFFFEPTLLSLIRTDHGGGVRLALLARRRRIAAPPAELPRSCSGSGILPSASCFISFCIWPNCLTSWLTA